MIILLVSILSAHQLFMHAPVNPALLWKTNFCKIVNKNFVWK